ncbi:MAG: hypothetical protein ACK42D_01490 [Candidatus Paceibacteria bacterium]
MINLIPPAAKKRVVIEYWVRAVSLWAFLGGSALLLMSTLFIPLNIYVVNQESYLATLLAGNEFQQSNHEQNTALIFKANQQALFLLQDKKEYTLYELLPTLQQFAGSDVDLEDVALVQAKDPMLSVGGMALTRQSLVEFRNSLEKHEDFLTVNLPINNLIKESEVPFVITISLATSTTSI